MRNIISKFIDKLYFKLWAIGFIPADLKHIIRIKVFNTDINWQPIKSFNQYYSDPFVYTARNGNFDILCEDYTFNDQY